MAAEDLAIEDGAETQEEGKRERSTIQFPYLPLDEAVAIAKGVNEVGGTACQLDQLAGHLKQSPSSSMFKLRVSTARIFGLVTHAKGTVALSPLGIKACDPQQEPAARAESFLTVPLYKQVYEQFKGTTLPPNVGLETTMGNLGVAPKQKANARQVFQRSAAQAGFSTYGANRLVYPAIKSPSQGEPGPVGIADGQPTQDKPEKKAGNGGGGGEQHPFIQGLIKTLPDPSGPWPIEKRAQWLQAAVSVFNLIYIDDNPGSIEVRIQKGPNS